MSSLSEAINVFVFILLERVSEGSDQESARQKKENILGY